MQWQKQLYKKIGSKKDQGGNVESNFDKSIITILAMAKVLQGLHWVWLFDNFTGFIFFASMFIQDKTICYQFFSCWPIFLFANYQY